MKKSYNRDKDFDDTISRKSKASISRVFKRKMERKIAKK